VFDNSDSAVVIRVEKLALGAVNEPEILEAICAELDIKVFDNSDSALVTLVEKLELAAVNEPEILEAICAELDNAPMKIPEKSLPIILALELILPLAVTWVLAELPN
jgi:DNA-binding Xre family transcriptional regulator